MALVLRLLKGEDIFIDDERFVLQDVHEDFFALCRPSTRESFTIWPNRATEIMPEVMVSRGFNNRLNPNLISIVIEAPRSIFIIRGERYREDNHAHK